MEKERKWGQEKMVDKSLRPTTKKKKKGLGGVFWGLLN